ncbi:hypothetical protein OAS86_06610 [Gammaproteobacteria bacterium]|nr:hypothetical protein [Gammaproteobacteria bacterium]
MKRRDMLRQSGKTAWAVPLTLSVALPAHAQTSSRLPANTTELFNTVGTASFSVPAGITRLFVEISGGGGGGGSGAFSLKNNADGANGGAGDALQTELLVSEGDTLIVTVGAGGSAGASSGSLGGGGGGASRFGDLVASGGGGGGGSGEGSDGTQGEGPSGGVPGLGAVFQQCPPSNPYCNVYGGTSPTNGGDAGNGLGGRGGDGYSDDGDAQAGSNGRVQVSW